MQSQQPWAGHVQNTGDGSGLQEKPSRTMSLSLLDSNVSTVESFRILGFTFSQDLTWETRINSIVLMLSSSWESEMCHVEHSSTQPYLSLSCVPLSLCHQIAQKETTNRQDHWEDYWSPLPKNCLPSEWRNMQVESLWTHLLSGWHYRASIYTFYLVCVNILGNKAHSYFEKHGFHCKLIIYSHLQTEILREDSKWLYILSSLSSLVGNNTQRYMRGNVHAVFVLLSFVLKNAVMHFTYMCDERCIALCWNLEVMWWK